MSRSCDYASQKFLRDYLSDSRILNPVFGFLTKWNQQKAYHDRHLPLSTGGSDRKLSKEIWLEKAAKSTGDLLLS